MPPPRGRGAGLGRGRGTAAGATSTQPAPITPASLLQEAEMLQQRAERRSGQEALSGLEAAVAKYREALAAGLAAEAVPDASFGLAECLQSWGDLQRELLRRAPDEVLMPQPQHEQQVLGRVAEAYRAGLQAYQQVPAAAGSTQLRSDAAVNAANLLCSLAELPGVSSPQECMQLLQQAVGLYQGALSQEAGDADTLSNLGDAQVALGEAALAAGQPGAGQAAFEAALAAYQASCNHSDSAKGDDLPGLLHNWGVGLHSISKHAQDLQLKQSMLEQAAAKLRAAVHFSRADPAPHNALGDVLMDAAELLGRHGVGSPDAAQASTPSTTAAAAAAAAAAEGVAAAPPPSAAAAAAAIKAAVDKGYMAALTISRADADALVGLAEAAVALGKVEAAHAAGGGCSADHAAAALTHYRSALQRPHLLGDRSERCDVRYNAACAAALAGQAELCRELLAQLAAWGVLHHEETAADGDLASVRDQPWFAQLLLQS